MTILISFISGLIFSIGLGLSGMVNPQKVIGFLDIFGEWDFALAFVMAGAVAINFIAFKLLNGFSKPICAPKFHWPTAKYVDRKLVIGSSLFGVGWGLIGICPGPGLVNIVTLEPKMLVFVLSMITGMLAFKVFAKS